MHLYEKVTFPRIVEQSAKRDKWLVDIIEGRMEQDTVLQELSNSQVCVVRDYKFNGVNVDQLHYLCMSKHLEIKSLRDLNAASLPMLYHVRDVAAPGIALQYSVPVEDILMYCHYHPTSWVFHVHVMARTHGIAFIYLYYE